MHLLNFQEDIELLKKKDLSYNLRNSALLRSGEKEVSLRISIFVDAGAKFQCRFQTKMVGLT